MAILRARHLAKSYNKRAIIVDVSLQVLSGQIVGLLGPNGAGKTTCFYMIAGIVQPDAGSVIIEDNPTENQQHDTENKNDLTRLSIHQRARLGLGYLPQEASVFRKLSTYNNIMAVLETKRGMSRIERQKKANSLIDEFRLGHVKDSLGMALSGGERRRVEIARALASEPRFLLLDEPFAGVDPISVSEIKAIVNQLRERNIGVLITDHNVRETLDICEQAYIVGEGKIIAEGNADTILANDKVRDTYLGRDFKL